jgi:homoserine dehydrogenase
MKSEKKSFSDSLKLAQELGFAESDPSFDINGTDAAQKTSILSLISFAADISASDVYFEGIEHIDSQDMEYGEQLGFTLKPISIGRNSSSGISMGSFPAFIKKEEILASINNESNAVEINTKNLNSTAFSGPGAGGYPTACSVLNDILDIGQGKIFDYSKLLNKQKVLDFNSYISSRYLKIMIKDEMGAVADVSSLIAKKKLSIDNLIQKDQDKDNELVPLVIVLGASQEKIVQELIEDLSKLAIVEGNVKHIRIFSP